MLGIWRSFNSDVDYTVDEDNIVFTTAPRVRQLGDDTSLTSITFLNGFLENNIVVIDDISPDFEILRLISYSKKWRKV